MATPRLNTRDQQIQILTSAVNLCSQTWSLCPCADSCHRAMGLLTRQRQTEADSTTGQPSNALGTPLDRTTEDRQTVQGWQEPSVTGHKQALNRPWRKACPTRVLAGPLPFTLLFTAVQRAVKCEISFGKSHLDLGLDETGQTEGEIPNTFHSPAEAYVPPAPYRYKLLHIHFFPVLHYLEGATTESRNTPSITWQTGTVVFWKCLAHANFKTEPWYP